MTLFKEPTKLPSLIFPLLFFVVRTFLWSENRKSVKLLLKRAGSRQKAIGMIHMSKTIPLKVLMSSLFVILALMALVEVTQAKRSRPSGPSYFIGRDVKMRRGGCASFGHSCFGGHGKRAVPVRTLGDPEEIPVGVMRSSNDYVGDGTLPEGEIFSRDDGQLDAAGLNTFLKQQSYQEPNDVGRLASFVRKLIARYEKIPAE